MINIFNKDNLTFIGHRGLSEGSFIDNKELIHENTIKSFQKAVEYGFDWIELDVTKSKDDQLIIHHDTHDKNNIAFEECYKKDILVKNTYDDSKTDKVPTLSEVFDNLDEKIGVIVEIKPALSDALLAPNHISTYSLVAKAIADEHRKRPNRHMLSYSFQQSLNLYIKKEFDYHNINIDVGIIGDEQADLYLLLLSALQTGANTVSAHTSSFLNNHNTYPVEIILDIGRQNNINFVVWCPNYDEVKQLIDLGLETFCINYFDGFNKFIL